MTIFVTRKRPVTLLAAATATAFVLAGCASVEPDSAVTTAPPASGDVTFPVTIDTTRGEVTMDEEPTRIVSVQGDEELLVLLDIVPVAWSRGALTKEEVEGQLPWMEGEIDSLPETDPSLATAEWQVDVEAVAALEPDLILTSVWFADDEIYERLSQIAPTYADSGAPDVTWQEKLSALATLTGTDTAVVDEVIAEVDADFAAGRERIPGLQGATFHTPGYDETGNFWLTYYGNAPLTELGLLPGEGQATTAEEEPIVSPENLDLLNADIQFVQLGLRGAEFEAEARSLLDGDPRVAELPAKQNGTWIELTVEEWSAINGGGSPASLRYFLDRIVPQLEASALNQSGQ